MGVCYLMEYFIMTNRQKRFLKKVFKCLNISIEDLMKITKIEQIEAENKQLNERVTFLEQALKVTNEALVKLNGQTTEIATEVAKMQNEDLMELTKMQGEEIWGRQDR